jgi:hypothetical protein
MQTMEKIPLLEQKNSTASEKIVESLIAQINEQNFKFTKLSELKAFHAFFDKIANLPKSNITTGAEMFKKVLLLSLKNQANLEPNTINTIHNLISEIKENNFVPSPIEKSTLKTPETPTSETPEKVKKSSFADQIKKFRNSLLVTLIGTAASLSNKPKLTEYAFSPTETRHPKIESQQPFQTEIKSSSEKLPAGTKLVVESIEGQTISGKFINTETFYINSLASTLEKNGLDNGEFKKLITEIGYKQMIEQGILTLKAMQKDGKTKLQFKLKMPQK